jgi:hypothetical protein
MQFMAHYHFFPETNFFINNPNFNQYLFDTKPSTVVICRAVIRELDCLKKTNPGYQGVDGEKSYRAREASRTVEAIQQGKLQLLNEGKMLIYTPRKCKVNMSFDEEIETSVRQYADECDQNVAIVFLSSDRNLRILTRSSGALIVADPLEWERTRFQEKQIDSASQNKYNIKLIDLRYSTHPKIFPVYQRDWKQNGEIIVQKYFRYIRYQDRIVTIHLSARIAGLTFPLVIISADSRLLYKVDRKAYFIEPINYKKVRVEEGNWRIVLTFEDYEDHSSTLYITKWHDR